MKKLSRCLQKKWSGKLDRITSEPQNQRISTRRDRKRLLTHVSHYRLPKLGQNQLHAGLRDYQDAGGSVTGILFYWTWFCHKASEEQRLEGKTRFQNCRSNINGPLTRHQNALQPHGPVFTINVTLMAGLRVTDLVTFFTHPIESHSFCKISPRERDLSHTFRESPCCFNNQGLYYLSTEALTC